MHGPSTVSNTFFSVCLLTKTMGRALIYNRFINSSIGASMLFFLVMYKKNIFYYFLVRIV